MADAQRKCRSRAIAPSTWPSSNACGNVVLTETVQGFWDSRNGPIFARLGGYFETVDSWQARHRRARSHPRRHRRARPRRGARRDARSTWTSPTRDSARAGAARRPPDPSPVSPLSFQPQRRQTDDQQTLRPQDPRGLRPRGRRARRLRPRAGPDQAQVGPRLRDLGALPQVLGVGRRRDQEAHQRQVRASRCSRRPAWARSRTSTRA